MNDSAANLIEALIIIARADPEAMLYAERDRIWFGEYLPERINKDELEKLEQYGWFNSDESWSKHV